MVNEEDKFADAIGHVMLNAARAERLASVLVMRLGCQTTNALPGATWSKLRNEAIKLMGGLSDRARPDNERHALQQVRRVLDEASELMELRNLVAHGGWFVDDADGEPVLQIWVERTSGERFERWSAGRIAEIAAQLDTAADSIGWLANELREVCT